MRYHVKKCSGNTRQGEISVKSSTYLRVRIRSNNEGLVQGLAYTLAIVGQKATMDQ
jgi:hypothetical protein